jgi:DedD protein
MTPASAARLAPESDTEITLGTGKMLVLFFGLVVLCALFFGMGFTMGKNSVKVTPELLATPSGERPSAANKVVAPAAAPAPAAQQAAPQTTTDNSPSPTPAAAATTTTTAPTPTAPATTAAAPDQSSAGQLQPPPLDTGPAYFVQVAAVSKQEDAEALVEALKAHQYAAAIASNSSDKLFHVQIGPFTDIKDAEAMRMKLVNDGYSPILKR